MKKPVMVLLVLSTCFTPGCSPTVKMATPEKPITINLNVKIQHEILVKVDKELDSVLNKDSGLFYPEPTGTTKRRHAAVSGRKSRDRAAGSGT